MENHGNREIFNNGKILINSIYSYRNGEDLQILKIECLLYNYKKKLQYDIFFIIIIGKKNHNIVHFFFYH